MSETKSKVYRLFKVAKELNVGSTTLAEHLQDKGFEVKTSPNEKLTQEMYDVLLKAFASDQTLKEKAEQMREKQREERLAQEEQSQEELRNLSTHLQDAREKERRRIASDLHDELGQIIFPAVVVADTTGRILDVTHSVPTISDIKSISRSFNQGDIDLTMLSNQLNQSVDKFDNELWELSKKNEKAYLTYLDCLRKHIGYSNFHHNEEE